METNSSPTQEKNLLDKAREALDAGDSGRVVAYRFQAQALEEQSLDDLLDLCEEYDPETLTGGNGSGRGIYKSIRRRVLASQRVGDPTAALEAVTLGELRINPTKWLWPDRIPVAAVSYLYGRGGSGKSTIAMDLCARVTRGTEWPDGAPCEAGDVLYLDTENGAETTAFRMTAFGASLERFHYVDGTAQKFVLTDVERLEATVIATKARLVVIDPEASFLGGLDSNAESVVRPIVDGVSRVARRCNCAVLVIAHTRKGSAESAIEALAGSAQKANSVRCAIAVAPDAASLDDGRWVMGWTKFNLGPTPNPMGYRLTEGVHGALRVEWSTEVHADAESMYAEAVRISEGQLGRAMKFLCEQLQSGPVFVAELNRRAGAEGIPGRTLRRAAAELKVERTGGHRGAPAVWSLANDA